MINSQKPVSPSAIEKSLYSPLLLYLKKKVIKVYKTPFRDVLPKAHFHEDASLILNNNVLFKLHLSPSDIWI